MSPPQSIPVISIRRRALELWLLSSILVSASALAVHAQDDARTQAPSAQSQDAAAMSPLAPPERVDVEPVARDVEISGRLRGILEATGWFDAPSVSVREGVAFLGGATADEDYRDWAGDLARNTEGVVAVVNQMTVATADPWDFTEVRGELADLGRSALRNLPFIVLGVIVLVLAWLLAGVVRRLLRHLLRARISSHLLREVAARTLAFLVFLLGLYFVLRVSGLTRLAVSVIGGTGIIGLVLGIAFRDITENFLASLFLSLQQPFRIGDLIEVGQTTGYVQRLTSRTTVLVTLDGAQVQVPNATIFKSTIRNFTSNPKRRDDFLIGIGYEDAIPHAQDVALRVLSEHPAILNDPEPWVLVDNLGPSTVNLRVYYWIDGSQHSWLKVRSSVIRLVKRALQQAGVSLPDEARELIFPHGISVRMLAEEPEAEDGKPAAKADEPGEAITTKAEASLRTEAHELNEQAAQAWTPDGGENLLANGNPRP